MKLRIRSAAVATALAAFALAASAQTGGMNVEVGEWEMTSTTKNPVTGEPQSFSAKECVDQGQLGAESFLENSQGCTVSDVQTSASSMRWNMSCSTQGGTMTGRGKIQSSAGGKKVSGTMDMTASFGGQTMEISSEWSGRWLGPCP